MVWVLNTGQTMPKQWKHGFPNTFKVRLVITCTPLSCRASINSISNGGFSLQLLKVEGNNAIFDPCVVECTVHI